MNQPDCLEVDNHDPPRRESVWFPLGREPSDVIMGHWPGLRPPFPDEITNLSNIQIKYHQGVINNMTDEYLNIVNCQLSPLMIDSHSFSQSPMP